ncbi:peptidoglycan-associated lipoprotein Pal [Acuticoccus yangtzensis]|uniref:peptidoglycan-associated lipoprotein Pal n=1 Tax=Acuticoccus yangtzensis TaxID=1443441 RepID=UPI0009497E5D|nr:peptidoglycan-associated lipoprotein Pal [Acuticoccus yangtzensis]ORE93466.1 peptidoglycan-associated lipoprotein [Stappia sp. 22II-S9-Z10]
MTEFRTRRWFAKGAGAMVIALAVAGCAQKPANTGAAGAATPGSPQDFAVNVGDRVFFTVDSSAINAQAAGTLDRQAAWLQRYPQYQITVEGHADERGTREYNIALSARRAEAARSYLVSRGVPASRLRTLSFGKERPVAVCDAESCWNQNRRAVTVLGG